jgi:hypothetical protein
MAKKQSPQQNNSDTEPIAFRRSVILGHCRFIVSLRDEGRLEQSLERKRAANDGTC